MAVAAAAGLVGTGLGVYADYQKSKAQQRAVEEGADAKRQQAYELLSRSDVNIQRLKREAEVFKATQVGQVARSGAALRGNTLIQMEQLNSDLLETIADQRREAAFKAEQLMRGADIDTRLASDIRQDRSLSLFAGILGTAGKGGEAAYKHGLFDSKKSGAI